MANGRALIEPPGFAPLQYGLLSAANDRTPEAAGARWEAGVTWQSHCPAAGSSYDPCLTVIRDDVDPEQTSTDPPPAPADKTPTSELFLRGATPFATYARFDCSPVGSWNDARAVGLGEQALARSEARQVEQIFATGMLLDESALDVEVVFPHLQADTPLLDDTGAVLQTVATVLSTDPLDVVEAVGTLESALGGCYGGQGVLHVPASLGASLAAENLLTRQGAVLRSPANHLVALGAGYPGDSPQGADSAGFTWIYATGAVFYYRSPVQVHGNVDSFDRARNTVEAIAERRYVLGWDCCHFAVPVTVGGVPAGESGTAALEPSI